MIQETPGKYPVAQSGLLNRSRIIGAGMLLAGMALAVGILTTRELYTLKYLGSLARYNTTRLVPIVILLLTLIQRIRKPWLRLGLCGLLILPLFALTLSGLWSNVYSENNVIAGIIPRRDAAAWYADAVNLIERGSFFGFAARRPLFGGFFSILLSASGGNLQAALSILALLAAVAVLLLHHELQAWLHPAAAALCTVISFLFYRRISGLVMSEQLGFLLGVASFSLLLAAVRLLGSQGRTSLRLYLAGIFLFGLAQSARPGALLTLPLLALAAGIMWRDSKRFSWSAFSWAAGAVAAAFLVNTILGHLLVIGTPPLMSNMGYGLYGLVAGGKGWEQIFIDHPEIRSLPASQYGIKVLEWTWLAFIQHPENLVKGIAYQFSVLFSIQNANGLFSFMRANRLLMDYALILPSFLLSAIGIGVSIRRRETGLGMLMLACIAGFLLSLLVSPAYQTQYMRVYAASIPLLGMLPAIGLDAILRHFPFLRKLECDPLPALHRLHLGLAGLLIAGIIFGPFLVRMVGEEAPKPVNNCLAGTDSVIIRYYPGSTVIILRNNDHQVNWAPYVAQLDFRRDIHNICCDDDIAYFQTIGWPSALFQTVDISTGRMLTVVIPADQLPQPGTVLQMCGRVEDIYSQPAYHGFFYPSAIEVIE